MTRLIDLETIEPDVVLEILWASSCVQTTSSCHHLDGLQDMVLGRTGTYHNNLLFSTHGKPKKSKCCFETEREPE